jgi:hypothetical protein
VRYAFHVHGAVFSLFQPVRRRDAGDAAVGIERLVGDPGIVAFDLLAQDVVEEFHVRSG